jgi:hypothetical protein
MESNSNGAETRAKHQNFFAQNGQNYAMLNKQNEKMPSTAFAARQAPLYGTSNGPRDVIIGAPSPRWRHRSL